MVFVAPRPRTRSRTRTRRPHRLPVTVYGPAIGRSLLSSKSLSGSGSSIQERCYARGMRVRRVSCAVRNRQERPLVSRQPPTPRTARIPFLLLPSPSPFLPPPFSFLLSPFSFLPPSSLLLVCPAASHQPPIDCVPKKRVPSCWREPLCVSAYFFDTQKTRPFVLSLNVTGPPERRPGLCVLILPFLVLRWPCPDFFLSAKSESLPDVRTGSRWQRGFQCLAESRPACCPVASSVRQAPHRLCGPIARSVDFHTPTAIIKTRV